MRPPQHICSLRVFNELEEEISVKVTHDNTTTDEGDKIVTATIAPNQEHFFKEHTVAMGEAFFVCPISVAEVKAKGAVQLADLSVDCIVSEFHLTVKEKEGKVDLAGKVEK